MEIKENAKISRNEMISRAIHECLCEMYRNAQPPLDFNKYYEEHCDSSEQNEDNFFDRHYLSEAEHQYIIEKYIDAYRMNSDFYDDCDAIMKWFKNATVRKYIKENEDDDYGTRRYEDLPDLESIIGSNAYSEVIKYIECAKNFYRWSEGADKLRWAIFCYGPSSNPEAVKKYWKEQGKDIEIIERDPNYFYERYYEGYTEDEAFPEDGDEL